MNSGLMIPILVNVNILSLRDLHVPGMLADGPTDLICNPHSKSRDSFPRFKCYSVFPLS